MMIVPVPFVVVVAATQAVAVGELPVFATQADSLWNEPSVEVPSVSLE